MKWIIGLIAAAVLLIVAAVVAIPMLVDPNDHKDQIIAAVKSSTGRDLSISEPMTLSVFPSLAVKLGGVSLSNAAGFSPDTMAAVDELDLKVALMPLLSGSLQVDTIVLRGLALNLAKDKNGKTNWADLAKGDAAADSTQSASEDSAASGANVAVEIKGIVVERAQLLWDDQQSGKKYALKDLNFKTGAIQKGKVVPVALDLLIESAAPQQTLKFAMQADVSANDALSQFDINDMSVDLAAAGEGLPQGGLDIAIKANVVVDNEAGNVSLQGLQIDGPNIDLSGQLDATGLNGDPAVSGNFKLAESNLKQLLALGGSAPETADPDALTRVSAEFGIAGSTTNAALKPFTVKLDDSTFTGDFTVKSFTGPALRFALNLDAIDVDRYLPPAAESSAEPVANETSAAASDDPLAALRTLDVQGTVKVGQLKILNLNTSNIGLNINGKDGVLSINSINADLYEGKVAGDVRLDARNKEPAVSIKNSLSGVQIGPLLTDFSGNDKLVGQGNINVDLTTRGLGGPRIKETLNGTISVSLADGAYLGVDVLGTICSVGNKLDSLIAGATGELQQSGETKFSGMAANLVIENGVARNNDLDVKSPLLRVTGNGEANLPVDTIDYLVNAELVQACEGQSGAAADQLVGIPLPIRAQGPMSAPKIAPDWGALGQKMAESKIKDKAESLIKDKLKIPGIGGSDTGDAGEAAGGDIGGALKDGLKKLF